MSVLEVRNLSKSFGKTEVLHDINFSLEQGEALAIIGSSGGGKTTLLRCLNFLEFAEKGTISVGNNVIYNGENRNLKKESEIRKNRLHFGLVFQQFNLFPQYTVLENVTLAPVLAKRGTKENIEAIAKKLIARVGLTERMNFYPGQLSGGQQQRVAIARALAMQPDILCFDEPTSALDPELTGEVLKVIRSLKNSETTMIVVTHEMAFAKNVADKVIFMADGRIEECGTPAEVFDNPKSEKTRAFLQNSKESISD